MKPIILWFMGLVMFASCIQQKALKSHPSEEVPTSIEILVTLEYLSERKRTHFFPCTDLKVLGNKLEEQRCGDESFKQYLIANLNDSIHVCSSEGTVIIQFTVRKDANFGEGSTIQDIGSGCGEELLQILKKMPQWSHDIPRNIQYPEDYKLYVQFK